MKGTGTAGDDDGAARAESADTKKSAANTTGNKRMSSNRCRYQTMSRWVEAEMGFRESRTTSGIPGSLLSRGGLPASLQSRSVRSGAGNFSERFRAALLESRLVRIGGLLSRLRPSDARILQTSVHVLAELLHARKDFRTITRVQAFHPTLLSRADLAGLSASLKNFLHVLMMLVVAGSRSWRSIISKSRRPQRQRNSESYRNQNFAQ